MYPYANPLPFDILSTSYPGGLANDGFNAFLQQPWPVLTPGVLEASLLTVAAAAAGGWLAGIVPPRLNAAMTPTFGGFPPMMQAALPLSQPDMDPRGAIAFATSLSERSITDLILSEGRVPGPLLARLRMPGQSQSWQTRGPDGQPVTATFHRVDVPTDDGSWLLQADVWHGGRMMSSQLVRVHEAITDPYHPQAFRDSVARGHEAWSRRAGEGQDARMAVVCEDGARSSGAAAVLLRRASHEQSLEAGRSSASTAIADELARDDKAYIGECARTRGHAFCEGRAAYLNLAAKRTARDFRDVPDERPGAGLPPEALLRPPFMSMQHRMQRVDDSDGRSSVGTSTRGSYSIDDLSSQDSDDGFDHDRFETDSMDGWSVVSAEDASMVPWRSASVRTLSDVEVQTETSEPVVVQEHPAPAGSRRPESALLDEPVPAGLASRQILTPTLATSLAEVEWLMAQAPRVPTHDPAAADRARDQRNDERIIAAMARLPKAPATLPRSRSAPDFQRPTREAEAATTRALAQARSASESHLTEDARARPLAAAMGDLFQEIDHSLGQAQALKRRLGLGDGTDRAQSQTTDQMMLLVDRLRRAHQKRRPVEQKAVDDGGATFIVDNMAKAAAKAFKDLPAASRLRLVDAFHRNDGALAGMRRARDEQLKAMNQLSDVTKGGSGSLGAEFRMAQRKHEALSYTIAAMEFAVPAKA